MSFYSLSDLKFIAPFFSAMECFLNGEKAVYCSSEITSGLNLFQAMHKQGVTSPAKLKAKLGDDWFKKNVEEPNIKSANGFAAIVRSLHRHDAFVITPAPLKVPDWDQPEYLAYWEELIRRKILEVRFNDNWEYSNGCTFEIAVAKSAGLSTFDSQGYPISSSAAIASIEKAIRKVIRMNKYFDTSKLELNTERLRSSLPGESLPPKRPVAGVKRLSSHHRKSGTA